MKPHRLLVCKNDINRNKILYDTARLAIGEVHLGTSMGYSNLSTLIVTELHQEMIDVAEFTIDCIKKWRDTRCGTVISTWTTHADSKEGVIRSTSAVNRVVVTSLSDILLKTVKGEHFDRVVTADPRKFSSAVASCLSECQPQWGWYCLKKEAELSNDLYRLGPFLLPESDVELVDPSLLVSRR